MKTFHIRTALVILVALALVLPAAFTDAQTKGTIKIATQSPLSGGQAALGEGIKLG
ncbi:MAG: branched-chain amino acid ABC transporter substrate-binding protein, partial [Candidatus Rokubacteria bacterium]|nr:branched-chain amino acid ABC transporter substrate-binding protein [Candidatus Rokubacteria bacterium]